MSKDILNSFDGQIFGFWFRQSSCNDKSNIVDKIIDIFHELRVFVKSQLKRSSISSSSAQWCIRKNKNNSNLLNFIGNLTLNKGIDDLNDKSSCVTFSSAIQKGA